MRRITLITAILILTFSYNAFAGTPTNTDNVKSTKSVVVISENKDVINEPFLQLNKFEFKIENNISYLEKYQIRKSTSSKSKLHNVQNFLKNPEQKKVANIIILC